MPLFPSKIIFEIARHVEEDDFETMRNLSRVCRIFHAITLPLLFDTVIWDGTDERPWELTSQPCSGLEVYKDLYDDFRAYASSRCPDSARNDGEDDQEAIKNVFPSLVSILLHIPPIENTDSAQIKTSCQLHLYGTISPPDLVYACRPRPPQTLWEEYADKSSSSGENFDVDDGSSEDSWAPDRDITIDTLVLHRNARLLMAEYDEVEYPLHWVNFGINGSTPDGRTLDLRLLEYGDNTQETLDGCVWLFNNGVMACYAEPDAASNMLRLVKVICRVEMLRPMCATFRTQRPLPLSFSVCENLRQERRMFETLQVMLTTITANPRRLSAFCAHDEIFVIDGPGGESQEGSTSWRVGFTMGHYSELDDDRHVIPFVDTLERVEGDGGMIPRRVEVERVYFAHHHFSTAIASSV
ncbi:hypothetical protein QFC20_003540 [Naganishia adeliensis]|uniref:Uncharacterized protein n=1 Tax=Naganishia adeliensis TaxID=92952 RepID=A0ACC2W9P7_9TREE|nr:hypothetical protein QFC20_003540 [Naganishia adeliensis]